MADQSAQLREYAKYLDDHETYRAYRLQSNAIKKYYNIIQSVKNKYKDHYHLDDDDDDESKDDWCQLYNKIQQSDFPPFKKILKHHKARMLAAQSETNEQSQK